MSEGKLVKHEKNGQIGIIVEGPVKRPMVGHIYHVLFGEGFQWVYPENIEILPEENCLKKEKREELK